jgi:hypothetical protein
LTQILWLDEGNGRKSKIVAISATTLAPLRATKKQEIKHNSMENLGILVHAETQRFIAEVARLKTMLYSSLRQARERDGKIQRGYFF